MKKLITTLMTLIILASCSTPKEQIVESVDESSDLIVLNEKLANYEEENAKLIEEIETLENKYRDLIADNRELNEDITFYKEYDDVKETSDFVQWNYEINFINGDENRKQLTYLVSESKEDAQVVNVIGNNFSAHGEIYISEQLHIKGSGNHEFVKFSVFGDVYNFGLYSLNYTGANIETEKRELVQSLGDISNVEVMVETTLPEGLPGEVVRWNDEEGNLYEEFLSYDGLGASGRIRISCFGGDFSSKTFSETVEERDRLLTEVENLYEQMELQTAGYGVALTALSENEVETLYNHAAEVYRYFDLGTLPGSSENTVKIDGRTYYKVTSHYDSYQAMEKDVRQIFCPVLADRLLNAGLYKDIDGELYAVPADRGSNIYYDGERQRIVQVSPEEILYNVTVDLADESGTLGFRKHEYYSFSLVLCEDGQWRFRNFGSTS